MEPTPTAKAGIPAPLATRQHQTLGKLGILEGVTLTITEWELQRRIAFLARVRKMNFRTFQIDPMTYRVWRLG